MSVEEQDKIILIDKPTGWTSFDVVKKIRNCLGIRKVGHAGTLDPLATGLLILCTGKKTKEINEIQEMEKEYIGEFTLGQITDSFDLETPVKFVSNCKNVTPDSVIETTKKFVGTVDQIPPAFSAIKVEGKRAYLKARKGEKQSIQPRKVTLYSFEILKIEIPLIAFKVICSKGTYIRSLANDFGNEIGAGAYLSRLKRTRIGTYNLEDAATIEQICLQ